MTGTAIWRSIQHGPWPAWLRKGHSGLYRPELTVFCHNSSQTAPFPASLETRVWTSFRDETASQGGIKSRESQDQEVQLSVNPWRNQGVI